MKVRWIKTPAIIKKLFPKLVWSIPNQEKKLYLTFDDGPTPEVTEWVLNQLKKYHAKATFFCIGENIHNHPDIFKKVLEEGHTIGNHTYNHLNGWKTPAGKYINNTTKCQAEIEKLTNNMSPKLFRPPYGKFGLIQSSRLKKLGYKIIMWDVISYDFDTSTEAEKCLEYILNNTETGSVLVFHDSIKAFKNLEFVLPKVLNEFSKHGYRFEAIT
jgi:peptidoglycan-N-acetylglucosamine deacetylase